MDENRTGVGGVTDHMNHTPDGLARSAALMQALGARGSAIWAALSPQEASRLSAAMETLPHTDAAGRDIARAFVADMTSTPAATTDNRAWDTLGRMDGAHLAALLADESPQIMAVILSRLPAETAAAAVRTLPKPLATEALRRLLSLGTVQPAAMSAIEHKLELAIQAGSDIGASAGHQRVARIFDNLSDQIDAGLLAELDRAEPGAGKRIRALMFTFDDLATLGPASLQTLLSHIDRSTLIAALKGARPETANAFFSNMTARARELLVSEIDAADPMQRSDVSAARQNITALARTLAGRGDILTQDVADDELVA